LLTKCPACDSVFRVVAAQLGAARGQVRCGICYTAFNALTALADELPNQRHPQLVDALPQPPKLELPTAPESPEPPPEKDPTLNSAPRAGTAPAVPPLREELFEIELDLHGPKHGRGRGKLMWGLAVLLLSAAMALQILWYERYPMLERYPDLERWYTFSCRHLGCNPPRLRRLDALSVLARDVREHPRYLDALLVNATLVNEAPFAQPYPQLQLTLYDLGGGALAARRFEPGEYLDESIDRAHGMLPGVPVHIVLELDSGEVPAEGFEFKFL